MNGLSFKGVAVAVAALVVCASAATDAGAQTSSRSGGGSAQERAERERQRGETRSTSGERRRGGAGDAAAVQEAQRTRGRAEAPAVAQAANLNCQIADALYLGSAGEGATLQNVYEVACTGALGYVLVQRPAPQPVQAVDCLSAKTVADREEAAGTSRPTRCTLPANANPAVGLQPIVQQLGRRCTIDRGRAVGGLTSGGGGTRFEVGCTEGGALVIDAPTPGSALQPAALSCLQAAAANAACEYETQEQQIAAVRPRLAGPAASCQVSGIRYAGRPTQRPTNEVVEIACGATGGFLIESDPAGATVNTWSCGSAEARGLPCELTNTAVAETQDAELYAASARAIGLTCPVTRYRRVGLDQASGREVVELVCGQNTEATIAYFPIPGRPNQNGETLDCLRAEARGIGCRLTPIAATYPRLTQLLQTAGQACPVSAVRRVGRLEQEDFIEVACDPTRRGFFVALPVAPGSTGIGRVITCANAREYGSCQLPANAPGDRPRS